MLQPAFAAAVKALGRLRGVGRELASCVDQVPVPILLVGPGEVLHANAAFSRTLGSVTDAVAAAVIPRVRKLLRQRIHSSGGNSAGTVHGPAGSLIPWSVSLLSSCVSTPLALVQFFIVPKLEITVATRERFRLTPRQAEVAELMAEGRTYREIAGTLGIRPNTARRHWEQVLQRLGVHSRYEVQRVVWGEAR